MQKWLLFQQKYYVTYHTEHNKFIHSFIHSKIMKAEEIIKDEGDIVVILENTVSSKIEEILSLKEQLKHQNNL